MSVKLDDNGGETATAFEPEGEPAVAKAQGLRLITIGYEGKPMGHSGHMVMSIVLVRSFRIDWMGRHRKLRNFDFWWAKCQNWLSGAWKLIPEPGIYPRMHL